MANLTSIFAKHGIAVGGTVLWGEPEMIAEDLPSKDFRLFVSQKYDNSVYITVDADDGFRMIGFASNEVSEELIEEWDIDAKTGEVLEHDLTVGIGIVEALRNDLEKTTRNLDNDLVDITKGVKTLRAYIQ